MKYWFSSDYHFGHANIIKYCDRPFSSVEEMNEKIISNHNDRVSNDDVVFFLGDFCFKNSKGGKQGEGELLHSKEYIDKLNGNFVFIKGNHDKNNSLNAVIKSAVISIGGEKIYLVHNPADYNDDYNINIVGHVHESWRTRKIGNTILVNVGVDVWNFKPIDIQEILKEVKNNRNIYKA